MRSLLRVAATLSLLLSAPLGAQTDTRARVPVTLGDRPPAPMGATPPSLVVEPVAMMIAAFDQDQDGRVTRDELQRGVRHSFEAIDTAHAGSLGYIGFADWATRWLGDPNALPGAFETDANGDNRITLDEVQAKFAAIFKRLDRNGDGVLVRAELVTIRGDIARGDDGRRRKGRDK